MKPFEMILFIISFICIVVYLCISINKIEKELKEIKNKQLLNMENDEYDYGHNISHKEK